MKFLVIDFEIIERGGINRIVEGLKYGLEAAGSQFDYFWASTSGKLRSLSPETPTMVNDRYYRLAARQLSYGRPNSRREYSRLLRRYDVVLFMLPCPHDIKGKNGDMSWMMLYEEAAQAGKPIVTIIHDNLWDKYYGWYRQVSDLVKVHLFTCYQSKYDSLARLPGTFIFLPTPLNVKGSQLFQDEKTGYLCWMPQWKKWKGIYQFLEALPSVTYPVDIYNSGIEYHNARQDPSGLWKTAIGLNHVNKTKGKGNPAHQYWGSQLPDAIPGIYQTHRASLDLSGSIGERFDGQTSCVMLEAMLYGCISVVHEKVDTHPWSPLAGKDVVWTVPSEPAGIAERINEILRKPKTRARIGGRALEFVREYSDARKAAYSILEFLEDHPLDIEQDNRPHFLDDICQDPVPEFDEETYEKHPYFSKNAKKLAPAIEPEEEPIIHGIPVELAQEIGLVGDLASTAGRDGRWIRFVSKVAAAWIDVFGRGD